MTQNISLDLKNYGLLADGYKFDEVGSYEILKGWAYIKVDPKLANNAKVVDIEYASTNKEGTISFSTEIFILCPADKNRANGKLFFDYGASNINNTKRAKSSLWTNRYINDL